MERNNTHRFTTGRTESVAPDFASQRLSHPESVASSPYASWHQNCYDSYMAPTIFRQGAFRFFFFSREEPRMHVHVAHTDGEAKFWLEPQIELAMNQGLSNKQLNEASSLVQDHYEEIIHAWRNHF